MSVNHQYMRNTVILPYMYSLCSALLVLCMDYKQTPICFLRGQNTVKIDTSDLVTIVCGYDPLHITSRCLLYYSLDGKISRFNTVTAMSVKLTRILNYFKNN